jgi:hypothetical protein
MPKTAVFTKFRFVYFLAAFVVLSSCGSSITYDHASFRPDTVDAGNIRFAKNMYRFVQVNVREKNSTTNEQLQSLEFSDSLPRIWRNRFPPSVIEKELFLRFYLSNSGDSTQKLFFYPGAYFNSITIFEKEKAANKYEQVSIDSTPPKWRLGFRQFDLAARDTAAFLVRLNVLRSTATLLYPIILQKDFVEPFVAARVQGKKVTTMFTYLVAGIMLMMILYSLAVYRLNRSN